VQAVQLPERTGSNLIYFIPFSLILHFFLFSFCLICFYLFMSTLSYFLSNLFLCLNLILIFSLHNLFD
jgi:hypothetical protein